VNSSFEYLPAIPICFSTLRVKSQDFVHTKLAVNSPLVRVSSFTSGLFQEVRNLRNYFFL
jgi:hypothetical protein